MSDIVAITAIAAGGEGVGRLADGRAVFVARTAPGERIRLREGVKLHKSFARGELAEIVAPGAARVTAPCPHYVQDHCGGCQLQHVTYEAQLAAKQAIVGDALRRIAKLDVGDPEIVEAVEEWRYRAKISLAVKGGGGRARAVGLHPYDRPVSVFPLIDCHVADFRLMALWRELRPHLDLLPPKLTRLTLRLDRQGRRHVIAESTGEPWRDPAALRAALPDGDSVICWWQPADGAPRVVAGPATGFPATAFERVNPEMGTIARAWVVEQLGDVRGAVVWDLYGGIGDTAVELAERGAQVVSVDADEKAIDWARRREARHPRPRPAPTGRELPPDRGAGVRSVPANGAGRDRRGLGGGVRETMRNAECGVRNISGSMARRATFHANSAFRISHSAFGGAGE